jgi:hypothetical protein
MGKQNKKEPLIKINPRQFAGKRNTNACGEELQSFFACLAVRIILNQISVFLFTFNRFTRYASSQFTEKWPGFR